METCLAQAVAEGATLVTSVVSYMEFCVKPEQVGRPDIIQDFNELLRDLSIEVEEVSRVVAAEAAKLRATHSFLKGMDALQIAAAVCSGCDGFLTNDSKLKNVVKIPIWLITEL